MKHLFFSFTLFCLPILASSQNQVVINEIMFSPIESDANSMHNSTKPKITKEWVELYNPSACNEVDISCWVLGSDESAIADNNYGIFVFPQGTKIPPLGFIVVGAAAATPKDFDSQNSPNFCGNSRWFLNNNNGWVGLFTNTGEVVNAVYWSSTGASSLKNSGEFENPLSSNKNTLTCICSGSALNTTAAKNIAGIEFAGTSSGDLGEGWERENDGSKTWIKEKVSDATPKACNGVCAKPLTAAINGVNPISCDAKGSATITVSDGTPPYKCVWSNGATGTSVSGLAVGTYSCTVTDAYNCTVTKNVTIENKGGLVSTITSEDEKCGLRNGKATINAVGAVSYSWNTVPPQFTQTAVDLPAGTYVGMVKDANGCASSSSVTIKNLTTVVATVSGSPALCTSPSGSATVTPSAGVPPFVYTWNTTPVQTTATATNLGPGKYTCKVVDNTGCIVNMEIEINAITKTLTADAVSTNAICTASNGSAGITPTSGDEPYTYLWNNNSTTKDLTALPSGNYSVTFSDKNGCTGKKDVVVGNITDSLKISATVTDETCTNKNGQITTVITGGTLPYAYTWNNINSPDQSLQKISAGVYTLIATDVNGCVGKSTSNVKNIITIDVESSVVKDHCDQGIGSITLIPKNGQAPFTYLWETTDTTKTLDSLHEGVYTATVKDALGCQNTNKYSVENIVDKFTGYVIGNRSLQQDEESVLSLDLPANWKLIYWIGIHGDTIRKPTITINVPYPQYGDFQVQYCVMSDFGCIEIINVPLYVEPSWTFYIPNCITLNSDLTNDKFFPKYTGISEMQGWVFDRWGQKLFTFSGMYDQWDGTFNGEKVQQDIYVYRFVFKDLKGIKHERVGSLLVLKAQK